MRDRIIDFIHKLNQYDPAFCGDAPKRIVDDVADKFCDLIKDNVDDEELKSQVEAFALGAIRYVADQCGSEADTLLASLGSLKRMK